MMKSIFKKTWFQILFLGAVIGAILILVDNKTNFVSKFKNSSSDTGTYNGPVSVDKSKTFFTSAKLSEDRFDFGKVKEGDTLTHVFKITNTGKEPLTIFKNNSSCDCVGAVVTKEMIQPGAEEEITAHFKTKGRKGPQTRTIEITCNTDPATITITLKADVQ